MDKEKILAARKKLKEFQRNKKDQARKNEHDNIDPETSSSFRKVSSNDSVAKYENYSQQELQSEELLNNGGHIDNFIKNSNDISHSYCDSSTMNNVIPSLQDSLSFPYSQENHESNGVTETPTHNFTSNHSRNESNSTASSQIIHENVDHIQNLSTQKFLNLTSELNLSNNGVTSLQKENLLTMANAVTDALVDQQRLDESALKNSDLEQKNQYLTCCLEEQKKIVNQLYIQVSQCNSKISELEAIITTKDMEFESKYITEVNPLKEQIQLDAQTIGILIGEKADLTAANAQCQMVIKQKTEEVTKLSDKLKNSQQREFELEKELTTYKNNTEDLTKSYKQLQKDYEEVVKKSAEFKKINEDFELEVSELRQKVNCKNSELLKLQKELQENVALLSLSELRVQQLTNSPQEATNLENQHRTAKVLEHQLSQMKEALEFVSGEKDEVSKKYQSYVQQLNERYSQLTIEFDAAKKVIADSEIREQSYIQRLSELEQQLQKNNMKPVTIPVEDQSEKINMLTKSIDNLVLEQENLAILLNEKDHEIELLKKDLVELEGIREQNIEASKLAAALQSEQLGASRAVSQNQQLKTQLDEMHDAFIALSNTKLDLTEQLQAERTIGKKLNVKLNEVEQQLSELKNQLSHKELVLQEFEKEKLQAAQVEDQIQHYQAQSHSATTLQHELQKALMTIENLKEENQVLQVRLAALEQDNSTQEESIKDVNLDVSDKAVETIITADFSTEVTIEKSISTQQPSTQSMETLNIPESFKKLEKRFKETMEKIAELTDEKQRLEHLVLQLQGETETIGEYVTLYQKQRTILQNKARERENTFRELMEQRNQQQVQLHKLKMLVAELLKSKNLKPMVAVATPAEENMPVSDNISGNIEVIDGHEDNLNDAVYKPDETTSQILDLLTEIKDCNNTCNLEPNFHPCPWCSGKLITV